MLWMLMLAIAGLMATFADAGGSSAIDGAAGMPASVAAPPTAPDGSSTLDAATAFLQSAGGGSGAAEPNGGQPGQPDPNGASGGVPPPDPQRGPIPYDRFQEVVHARQSAEAQLAQLTPYAPLIEQLAQAGWTAEQTLGYLQNLSAAQAPVQGSGQPAAPFGLPQGQQGPAPILSPEQQETQRQVAWLHQQGLDAETFQYLEPWQQNTLRNQYQLEQRYAAMEAAGQAAQQQAMGAELTSQMQAVQQQFPIFQDPTLERALYAQFAFDAERGLTLAQSAQGFAQSLNGLVQTQITHYAANKQADAAVPVTAGGAAPNPVNAPPDINKMNDLDRRNHVREYLRATSPAQL